MFLPKFLSRKISPEKSLDFLSQNSVLRPAFEVLVCVSFYRLSDHVSKVWKSGPKLDPATGVTGPPLTKRQQQQEISVTNRSKNQIAQIAAQCFYETMEEEAETFQKQSVRFHLIIAQVCIFSVGSV